MEMSNRSNSQFVVASVKEFPSVWALNLSTSDGLVTVGFNCTLGHPGPPNSIPAFSPPLSPPTSSTSRQPRHRGPAETEKNLLRAARHQAAQAEAAAPASPVIATAPVSQVIETAPVSPVTATSPVKSTSTSEPVISSCVTESVMSTFSSSSSK